MLKKVLLITGLLLTGLFFAEQLAGQTQTQADVERSLLPDIDPQDIEIRSQFQARFPGLSRQPILGFNPRPRVYQIDPDRIPYIEDEEAQLANLPMGRLDRPDSPEYNALGYAPPKYAFIRAGVGSDITPEADLFAIGRIDDGHWVSGSLRYHSSDGHDERVATSYRNFDGVIRSYNRLSEKTRLQLHGGISSDFNHQLATESADSLFTGFNSRTELFGFRGGAEVTVAQTTLTGIKAYFSSYGHEYSLSSDLTAFDNQTPSDWGLNAGGEYSMLGQNINEIYRAGLDVRAGAATPADSSSQGWSVTTLSGTYERLFNYRTDVKISAGLSGVTDSEHDFKFYFSPRAEIKHTFFRGFNIRGLAYGEPSYRDFREIHRENRFFDFGNPGVHQYEMAALGEIQVEPFIGTKITGGISYKNISNHLYYSRRTQPMGVTEIERGYYGTLYDDATMVTIFGGLAQDLKPEVIWLSANASLREHTLSGIDGDIPYTETFSVASTISFRPVRDLLVEGWGEFNSGRKNEFGDSLSSFVRLGGRFEFSINENFGIYGKLLNVLDEEYEYWDGFQEHGFRGFVGVTLLF